MRKTEITKRLFEYLFLMTAGVFFILLLSLFKNDRTSQYIIMTFFAMFYIVWGVVHHIIRRTFHVKIVIEYILIAGLAILLLQIVLLL